MVHLFDHKLADTTSSTESKTLKVNEVHNIAIKGKLECSLEPNIRALSKAMDEYDWADLVLNSLVVDHCAEVVEGGVTASFGRDIFTEDLDTISNANLAIGKGLEQVEALFVPLDIVEAHVWGFGSGDLLGHFELMGLESVDEVDESGFIRGSVVFSDFDDVSHLLKYFKDFD